MTRKFLILTTILLLLSLEHFGQTFEENTGSIVWDLGPEHPRIDLQFGTKGLNSAGYEDTAPVITNNFPDVLLVKVEFEVFDFCGGSQTFTAFRELAGREKYAPNPFMSGFQFETSCKESQTYGSGKEYKTRIESVGYTIVMLRNLTEERQKAAAEKARRESEAAQQKEGEAKEAAAIAAAEEAEKQSVPGSTAREAKPPTAKSSTASTDESTPLYGKGDNGKYYKKQTNGAYEEISYDEYQALTNQDRNKEGERQEGPTVDEINAQLQKQREDYEAETAGQQEVIGSVTEMATGLAGSLMAEAQRNRYAEIARYVKYSKAAEEGDTEAMAWMAQHEAGSNPKKANAWLFKAADRGNIWAIETVVNCLKKGSRKYAIAQDRYEATNWQAKLEHKQTSDQMLELAVAAHDSQEWSTAFVLFNSLAEKGHRGVYLILGLMYYDGRGTRPDQAAAVEYFAKAADEGDAKAMYYLGACYLMGKGIKANYKHALHWLNKAQALGSVQAMTGLGIAYLGESGGPADSPQAVEWFRKAVRAGDGEALAYLANLYRDGAHGQPKDIEHAKSLYLRAIEKGASFAEWNLAALYVSENEYTSALPLLINCAQREEPGAMYYLGLMHYHGEGVEQDYNKAFDLLKRSAEAGEPLAMTALADCYEEGNGTVKDDEQARQWREKAEAGREQ